MHPILEELLPKHKKMVLEKLSPSVPLKYAQTLYIAPSKLTAPSCRVTSHLVSDEDYWKKCCTTRWGNCDVSKYGKCWKRMFFEKNAQEALEKFVPDQSDLSEVRDEVHLTEVTFLLWVAGRVIKIIKSFHQVLGYTATITTSSG